METNEVENVVQAPEPGPEPKPVPGIEAVATQEPEPDLAPQAWMADLLNSLQQPAAPVAPPSQPVAPVPTFPPTTASVQPAAGEQAHPWEGTLLDDPSTIQKLDAYLAQRDRQMQQQWAVREQQLREQILSEVAPVRGAVEQWVGRDIAREVHKTVESVHVNAYGNVFKNDPAFRGNPKVAAAADGLVGKWCEGATRYAQQTGDTSNLEFARTPQFARIILAMAKAAYGSDGGGPVIPKGAEVEGRSTGASTQPRGDNGRFTQTLTQADRDAMQRYGITETELRDAQKFKSDVDYGPQGS
jgi:hypothetical protein